MLGPARHKHFAGLARSAPAAAGGWCKGCPRILVHSRWRARRWQRPCRLPAGWVVSEADPQTETRKPEISQQCGLARVCRAFGPPGLSPVPALDPFSLPTPAAEPRRQPSHCKRARAFYTACNSLEGARCRLFAPAAIARHQSCHLGSTPHTKALPAAPQGAREKAFWRAAGVGHPTESREGRLRQRACLLAALLSAGLSCHAAGRRANWGGGALLCVGALPCVDGSVNERNAVTWQGRVTPRGRGPSKVHK